PGNILPNDVDNRDSADEPYRFPACNSTDARSPTGCVSPGGVITQSVWSEPAKHLLQYIPAPSSGESIFSSGSENKIVRDDKWSFRSDSNHARWGQLSAYYFFDDYTVNNPYPAAVGRASVPGLNAR